jgi:tRNA(Ile)-lysidine synthase
MPPPADSLGARLLAESERHGLSALLLERPLVVGVSGGPDSLALLHLLVQLRGQTAKSTLHVAHLDHLVRGDESREDAEFVRHTAVEMRVPVTVAAFDVPGYARSKGLSIEDAARRARYAFLASVAQRYAAAVAVAHNADDQVETVLMAILRGTGITGLAGMSAIDIASNPDDAELHAAFPHDGALRVELYRPLLGVWRYEIENYCRDHGLEPRTDSTNVDQSYRRNRIRYGLIPYLQQNYSLAVKDHLYRLSDIARAEDVLAEAVVEETWGNLARVDGSGGRVSFVVNTFASQPEALRRRLARHALQIVAGTLTDFTFAHVEDTVGVLSAADDAPPAIDLPRGVRVERVGGAAVLRKRSEVRDFWQLEEACGRPVAGTTPLVVVPGRSIELEHGWTLETAVVDAALERPPMGDWHAAFDYDALAQAGTLVVRRRAPGDYLRPLGMSGRRRLQDVLVDAKIPRECRMGIAVLAPEGSAEVLWVPGPGGRRSGYAPLTRDTQRVLAMHFIKQE